MPNFNCREGMASLRDGWALGYREFLSINRIGASLERSGGVPEERGTILLHTLQSPKIAIAEVACLTSSSRSQSRTEAHLYGTIQMEDDVYNVVCIVNCGDAPHHQRMVHHTSILDETTLGAEILQSKQCLSLRMWASNCGIAADGHADV